MSTPRRPPRTHLGPATRRALFVVAFAAVALGVTAFFLADDVAARRARTHYPRVVLVTLDTLNIWYTDLYSEGSALTPNLRELAADGVLFEHSYTPVPLTLPSHTSLLTGRSPMADGVLFNGAKVPDEVVTLPEILRNHGYRSAAFVSLGVLNSRANLDQGFERYDDVPAGRLGRWFRNADEVVEPALEWIDAHADEPFFLWVHLSDPHAPYTDPEAPPDVELRLDGEPVGRFKLAEHVRNRVEVDVPPGRHVLTWVSVRPPRPGDTAKTIPVIWLHDPEVMKAWATEPEASDLEAEHSLFTPWTLAIENRYRDPVRLPVDVEGQIADVPGAQNRASYRAEVTYADRHLGKLRRFLEDRDLEQETLWLVVSDHGEGLYAHGSGGHALHNWEEQLRTVLLIKGPGVPAGRRIGDLPVLNQDAFPTLLDVLGLPIPDDIDSASLVPCWTDDGCESPRPEWLAYGLGRERTLSSASVYRWPFKAIAPAKGRGGVFDLLRDPREQQPLIDLEARADRSIPEPVRRLRRQLSTAIPPLQRLLAAAAAGEIDEAQREMLEGLGYL